VIIDLAHYQADAGRIDYRKVQAAISGAYIKVTQGATYIDPTWRVHGIGLRGVPRGAYHYCTGADPSAEAHHFAGALAAGTWELRPAIDIEYKGATAGWLKEFIAALRAATGLRKLRVYSNIALLRVQLLPKLWIDPDLDIWAARYNDTLGWDHPQLVLWQHTQSGGTPGITGPVDQSVEMHGWTPAADQQRNGDDVAWTQREGAPEVPDYYPGRPKGATLADPLLALAWDTAHSAVARDMATLAVQKVDALRADLAAGKLSEGAPTIDYDKLAAALLRQMSKPA
jgi:GH25 family lysozyme M1 (1,4-beta-N-acetylmuramidase)